jgi:hypothetical protein
MAGGGTVHKGGAPKKNKNAVGNSGKPKQFDISEEAKDLIEWAKKPDSLVLRMHGPLRGYACATMNKWADENVEYCEAYQIAKGLIGARREQLLVLDLNTTPYNRTADMYDDELFVFEEKKKDRESARRAKSENTTQDNLCTITDKVKGIVN